MEVFMIPLSSAKSSGLVWSKIPHKYGYELKSNGEVVGSLLRTSRWPALCTANVLAESGHGSWKFRRTGALHTGMEISDASTNAPIAKLKPNLWGGGVLVFSDGESFKIISKGVWRPVWSVLTRHGQPLIRMQVRPKTVEFTNPGNVSEERMILLTLFTWHVMKQAAEDAGAIAGVVAAIAATSLAG
jgi:hypothetical protein